MNTIKHEELAHVTGGTSNNIIVNSPTGSVPVASGDYVACLNQQKKQAGFIQNLFAKNKVVAQQLQVCGPMLGNRVAR